MDKTPIAKSKLEILRMRDARLKATISTEMALERARKARQREHVM